jgi:hypothetical protein
MSGFY